MDRYLSTFVGHRAETSCKEPKLTNLNRWKLACALFAALAGYGVVSAHRAHDHNAPASSVITPRGAAVPFALRKPIHVAPEALGVSQHDLIDRILAARSVHDVGV